MEKLSQEIIQGYLQLDTSSISDAMDKLGIAGGLLGIQAEIPGTRICGQAFTVHYVPCGLVKGTVGDFLDDVTPGDVVVIDNSGRNYCTVWGDIMSQFAKARGIGGTLIDGVCRDLKTIREIRYPIFTKGHYMMTGKDRVEVGSVNEPVTISGVKVCPGDLIVGDENGAVCIPLSMVEQVLDLAKSIEATEQKIISAIQNGISLREARKLMGYHHLQTKA